MRLAELGTFFSSEFSMQNAKHLLIMENDMYYACLIKATTTGNTCAHTKELCPQVQFFSFSSYELTTEKSRKRVREVWEREVGKGTFGQFIWGMTVLAVALGNMPLFTCGRDYSSSERRHWLRSSYTLSTMILKSFGEPRSASNSPHRACNVN